MKKNLFVVLFMFILLFSLVSCSGGKSTDTNSPKEKTQSKSGDDKQETTKGGKVNIGDEILLGDGKFVGVIEEIKVLNDISDRPSVNIKYNVTNNSDEEKIVLDMFVMNVIQDGKDLEVTFLKTEDEDPNKRESAFDPIKPGENSGIDEMAYVLNSDSDITIRISNIDDAIAGVEYRLDTPLPK